MLISTSPVSAWYIFIQVIIIGHWGLTLLWNPGSKCRTPTSGLSHPRAKELGISLHLPSVIGWVLLVVVGFSGGTSGKEPACQCRTHKETGYNPWAGKIPWRRKWQPTPVFLPGESMDRGACWATVHGVTKSWRWLMQLSTHALVVVGGDH